MLDVAECVEAWLQQSCSASNVARVTLNASRAVLVFVPPSRQAAEEIGCLIADHLRQDVQFGYAKFAVDVHQAGESFTTDKCWCPGQQMSLAFPEDDNAD